MSEGTKYHPLFEYLLFSGQGHLSMTFEEIEAVLGARLPPSARRREEWWSNSPSGHSQARAWLRAHYRTSAVDIAGEKVDFRLEGWPDAYRRPESAAASRPKRVVGLGEAEQAGYRAARAEEPAGADHPLFGIWEGKVTLLSGYDYTHPVFEHGSTS